MELKDLPFVKGKILMHVNGPWAIGAFEQHLTSDQFGVTYIPTADGSKVSWSGGWSYVVPRGAKNPKEAVRFIKFITSVGAQHIMSKTRNLLPIRKDLVKDKTLFSGHMKFFQEILPYSKSRPAIPVGSYYWQKLHDAQLKLFSKDNLQESDIDKELKAVQVSVQKRLKRFCK